MRRLVRSWELDLTPRLRWNNRHLSSWQSTLGVAGAIALFVLAGVAAASAQETKPPSPFGQPPTIPDEELDANDELAKALRSPRPEVRIDALELLSKRRPPGQVRAVLRALADPDPRVSLWATLRLHNLASDLRPPSKPKEAIPAIVLPAGFENLLAQTESPDVRGLIAIAWERSSPDVSQAMPRALKGLMQLDAARREAALLMLVQRKYVELFPSCFSSDDVEVRRGVMCVARAMVESDGELKPLLDLAVTALQDSDAEVRGFAVLTLARTKIPEERLVAMTKDKDAFVRACAIRAIQQRESPRIIEWFTPLAQNDPSVRVRLRATLWLRDFVSMREEDEAQEAAAAQIKLEGIPRALFEHLSCANDPFRPWWPKDRRPLSASVADEMVAQIAAAIDEERRQPLPPYRALMEDHASDEFELFLFTCIAECSPHSRTALPRLFQELRKLDSLGQGDDRCSAEARRLSSIWNALQYYATQGAESTRELARALDDSHRVVRTVAALALVGEKSHTEKCIRTLIESLNFECAGHCDYDQVERWDVMGLASAGHRAVPALLEQIRLSRNVPLCVMALENMRGDAENVIPLLLKAFDDPMSSPVVRRDLAAPLGSIGMEDRGVLNALMRRLADRTENEEVRCAAVRGLAMTGLEDRRDLLSRFQNDESPKVREAVRKALQPK